MSGLKAAQGANFTRLRQDSASQNYRLARLRRESRPYCSFDLSGGACQGGDDGHADLRLPCYWRRGLDGPGNGPSDLRAPGARKGLLPALPTTAQDGWD
jgi:hypothetical protein